MTTSESLNSASSEALRVLNLLEQDYLNALATWNALDRLYASERNDVPLLQRTASGFFSLVKHAFQSQVAMAISRLTDPGTMNTRSNASFDRLLDLLSPTHPTAVERLRADYALAKKDSATIRRLRNRLLAHTDFVSVDPDSVEPLARPLVADVRGVLAGLGGLLNGVRTLLGRPEFIYGSFQQYGDADDLVIALMKAEAFSQCVTDGLVDPHKYSIYPHEGSA